MRMVDRPLRVLVGHSAAVTGLSVCPTNARFLGSRSLDASVRIWDLEAAGEPLDSSLWFQPLDVGLDMLPMRGQWSHDGSFYATGSGCNVVVLAPFAEDPVSSARQLEGHLGLVTDCTFLYSMGGTSHVVVSASVDKSLYITPLS
jgi:WD40 repeat protein